MNWQNITLLDVTPRRLRMLAKYPLKDCETQGKSAQIVLHR